MRYSYYSSDNKSVAELSASASLDRFNDKELSVSILKDAIVVPQAGVYNSDRQFMPNSFWGGVVGANQTYDGVVCELDSEVYYIGSFHSCWGHEITDGVRLLWGIIPELGGIALEENVKFVYTMADSSMQLPRNFYSLLHALGITKDRLLLIDKPTQFKKIYLPDESYFYDINSLEKRTYSRTYQLFFDYLCKRIIPEPKKPTRIVFFSRSGWKKGNPDFGEKQIEEAFKGQWDCEIYRPEQLSFEEMVRILHETKTFITTEGSISHNALFMQTGTNIVILRKAGFISYYQLLINQIKNLNVTYVDAHRTHHFFNKETPYYGPFFLLKNKALADFLGIKPSFPICTYIRYRSYIIFYGIKICVIKLLAKIKHLIIGQQFHGQA